MTTLELQGRITENGNLEVELPAGLPVGEVTVKIEVPDIESPWEAQPWTEEELIALMKPEPKTGAEIAAMLNDMEPIEFVDPEITDPAEWLQAQRRKEANRLKPYWDSGK